MALHKGLDEGGKSRLSRMCVLDGRLGRAYHASRRADGRTSALSSNEGIEWKIEHIGGKKVQQTPCIIWKMYYIYPCKLNGGLAFQPLTKENVMNTPLTTLNASQPAVQELAASELEQVNGGWLPYAVAAGIGIAVGWGGSRLRRRYGRRCYP